MKITFKAHPLTVLMLIKPFLFILVLPIIKGFIEYIVYKKTSGILTAETVAFAVIILLAASGYKNFEVSLFKNKLTVKKGIIFKTETAINIKKLSCVSTEKNPLDFFFKAVTFCINTESGRKKRADVQFKLYFDDAKILSSQIYGKESRTAVKFSYLKLALSAAATSSAFAGLVIAAPVINKIGKLLNIALSQMLLERINQASKNANSIFPPIINAITIILIIGYAVSFIISFLKIISFRLFAGKEKIEVKSGVFIKKRTVFKKTSVNNICIEQTPFMRILRMYNLRAGVGGFGNSKGESATLIPGGKRREVIRYFKAYFPEIRKNGEHIKAKKSTGSLKRFLRLPEIYGYLILLLCVLAVYIFPPFDRLSVFLAAVLLALDVYYADICYYNYKNSKLCLGKNIYARGTKRFTAIEMFCKKEKIGKITVMQTPADRKLNTCKVKLTVRSQSAQSIKVRNTEYEYTLKKLYEYFESERI